MHVTVAYATAKEQVEIPLDIEESCTVALAIKRSGILNQFPEINLAQVKVGIYYKCVALDASLRDGDRIEIYRPLKIDPKQARLLRVKRASSSL